MGECIQGQKSCQVTLHGDWPVSIVRVTRDVRVVGEIYQGHMLPRLGLMWSVSPLGERG